MKSLSDFQSCGFDEAEIFGFLARHGVRIGEASTTLAPVGVAFPDWKRIMALHPKLTDTEAAAAFAGIDLVAPGWLSDDEQAELSRWQSVIRRAIRAGELVADESDFENDGTPKEWSILPADLVAWCSAKGLAYPLAGRRNRRPQCGPYRRQIRRRHPRLGNEARSRAQAGSLT